MELRAAVGFFLALLAIAMGGAIARALQSNPSDWSVIAAVLSASAAIAQATAALIMVRGLRHSAASADAAGAALRLTEQNSRQQLRAYLDGVKSEFTGFVEGDDLKIELRVRNYGQTPARDVKVRMSSDILPFGQEERLELGPEDNSPIMIAAGAEVIVFTGMHSERWAPRRHAVASGEATFVARFDIAYSDVFGEQHSWQVLLQARDCMDHEPGDGTQIVWKYAD